MVALKRPDVVIYHIGINDCVPRILRKGNNGLFFNPLFRKITHDIVLKFISKFRRQLIKILAEKVYISKERFRLNFLQMMSDVKCLNPDRRFFCISIAKYSDFMERKSPGSNKNIMAYNDILKELFQNNYIELDMLFGFAPDKYLISDGIHMTKDSHRKLALELVKRIGSSE